MHPPNPSDSDDLEGMLVLVKGLDAAGKPQWAYACIPYGKYEAFVATEARGNYNLAEFAVILGHGGGAEPPEEVKRQMEEQYGAAHDFEPQLANRLLQQEEGGGA